jgi:hypothetical protein
MNKFCIDLTSFCLDEFWIRLDTYQYRLDTDQLRRVPSNDPFLHHMQRLCCGRILLPVPITDSLLLQCVV